MSIDEYERLAAGAGLARVAGANWVRETITAWRHSIWVGVWDPWIVIWKGEGGGGAGWGGGGGGEWGEGGKEGGREREGEIEGAR